MKTISIPTNNRPALLTRCLQALAKAKGAEEWSVVFSCEPDADTISAASRYPHGFYLSRNPFNLGIWHNTFHAATLAMALKPTVNLYIEDDYVITPDALTMVDQWEASQRGGVICLRRPDSEQDQGNPTGISQFSSGLFGCGFAWKARDWPIVRRQWFTLSGMWDISMEGLPLPQWRPMVNRSHGIGVVGTHTTTSVDQNLFGPAYEGEPVERFTFHP